MYSRRLTPNDRAAYRGNDTKLELQRTIAVMTTSPDSIESVEAIEVEVPLERPLTIGAATITSRHYTVVGVRCRSGIEGVGYAFSRRMPIASIVNDMLAGVAVGLDACHTEAVRHALLRAFWPAADHGTFTTAVSAVDLALWDAMGKRHGMSVAQLLGQSRDRLPLCVVVGYVYDDGEATLRRELEHAVALGARSVKMVVGSASPERDAARVGLARSIIGPDRLLAVDAFRSFTDLDDALRRVRALQPHDLSFVEDPFSETLAPLAAELRRRTGMSIALGESLAGHRLVRGLIDADAGDVIRLDALVIGGVREFMAAAGLASAYGRPVATHVNTEIHVQFAAALPNLYAGGVEYMPPEAGTDALHRLLRSELTIADGLMSVPDAPGFGMDWDWEAIRSYARG